MATLELTASRPPIQSDVDGVMRIGGTRVRLETALFAFRSGCTPEEIWYKLPSLLLSDIYSVVAYYLQHTEEVEAYLQERGQREEEASREIQALHPSTEIRKRLLARRVAKA